MSACRSTTEHKVNTGAGRSSTGDSKSAGKGLLELDIHLA
jgi:hypothetical protein